MVIKLQAQTVSLWLFGKALRVFVKLEVMNFFKDFHEHSKFVRSVNATFVVLISKKGESEDLNDFKPISLVGSLYNGSTKVLANRFKRVLSKVVSKLKMLSLKGGRS